MSRSWPILVVSQADLKTWLTAPGGGDRAEYVREKVAELGETVLCWLDPQPGAPQRFSWVCPGCGGLTGGYIGDEPVSGWDSPRWVNTGTREAPTLAPSLGCPDWRTGTCPGHYWVREGRLVEA